MITRSTASAALRIGMLPVSILLPAGIFDWWQAWVVIGQYLLYAIGMWIWLSMHDPRLLRERLRGTLHQPDQPGWDRAILLGLSVTGVALLVVPGFDVVRYGWSDPLPFGAQLMAMAVHAPMLLALWWIARTNTYLSRVVKIDHQRRHSAVTSGPYAIVRHPMYAVVAVLAVAFPVALGSRWGLVPALPFVALLVLRTALEDRLLRRELDGYATYATRTAYRLIPGVW
ncbi:MAG: hypothetical protein KTR31_29585 [Myxococcales bacterium]|nr:hypothetical protein [Myxococcales bacterium]